MSLIHLRMIKIFIAMHLISFKQLSHNEMFVFVNNTSLASLKQNKINHHNTIRGGVSVRSV